MILAVFRKFLVLFICCLSASFGQVTDNVAAIELGATTFPIERPFTISVTIGNSDTRPTLTFPDIPGFTKKGITTTATGGDNNEKNGTNQIITQQYVARMPGRFVLAPFTITINTNNLLQSPGAVLTVRPSATASSSQNVTLTASVMPATVTNGAAFLLVKSSKHTIYMGEGVGLTLSFFVADNYPYELDFTALDRQIQAIIKKIRPADAWEENRPINELKPISVVIGGRKFREIPLYQSVFFPLAARPLRLPAVTLRLSRPRPKIGPPSAESETVDFSSKPLTINVRALPPHPLRGQVAVGSFRLDERLERQRVNVGQSIRYGFTIEGEGNVATLSAPVTPDQPAGIDLFPPKEQHTIHNDGRRVDGRKTFTYFIVPRQNGILTLSDYFRWIYFDPRRAQYDTLRPRLQVRVGGEDMVAKTASSASADTSDVAPDVAAVSDPGRSLYAGIDALDSTHQPISFPVLIRAVANVLIVLMLLGMIFVFFKK